MLDGPKREVADDVANDAYAFWLGSGISREDTIGVGVGIDFGPAFVGVVGTERLEFTVLGRTVNVARRLEELTKLLDQRCIVSEAVVRSARPGSRRARTYRELPAQTIRGCRDTVGILALLPGGGG